ncbi:DNA repair protein RadA/Sms [Dethiosulfatibacter aminovorans DSM 17477]|uniref:DNA repair protein RadA n=1 Tax=Dethiosulfatibacter aminovorans DSM 17477 TaxID=1121476 RepID=A0A1M6FQW7_9FIRM|nr:DNA repair protein RadA [Dethiosulfatibacter aminovorans]SHJ00097.1 DNA repair protein RadA/Sms [Dethiosulfatibacter aminovorans DSM 17477]
MAKKKTKFICQECGYESAKWMGKCPACETWNTFVEETITKSRNDKTVGISGGKPVALKEIEITGENRYDSGIEEFNRVLGGGVVRGSLVLVGGDPGIGKSTLLMQTAGVVSSSGRKVLYVSGEESPSQLKLRAERLEILNSDFNILAETDMAVIKEWVEKLSPDVLILDSIQTVYNPEITSAPGSVSQVKDATTALMNITKTSKLATFIVGHVTKQGSIAGPRVLEHMVDTVLYFEGDKMGTYRILRAVKNRFGSTNEIGVFEMRDKGLVEILNPSEIFVQKSDKENSGTVITSSIEGTRPILVEIQALVSLSSLGMPRRVTTGVDHNRTSMLMAVMEKKMGMQLQNCDAYVNVIGGLQLRETSVDLAILCAITSSFRDRACDPYTIIIGEVGLTGEIRGVSQIEKRINEAKKLGFKKVLIPKTNLESIKSAGGIEIIGVGSVDEAVECLF